MMEMEREKKKLVMEKCQSLLTELLRDEDNKYCVDCDAKSPRWASWNIGIFLCIRCAGIHRKLGVHISKVKSVNLDTWTPQQVANMGNSRARAVYEANLQDNFRRPQTDASLEQFIRAKYESKKYIAREWVPPPMPNPTWDLDIMKQLKKKRERKVVLGSIEFPAPIKSAAPKASTESPKPLPKAPGGRNASPGSASRRRSSGASNKEAPINPSATEDLLALDNPSSMNKTGPSDSSDIFGDFLAAPFVEGSADAEEKSFFNQTLPEPSSDKLSKDSILALYNKAPNHPTPFLGGGVPMMHLGTAVGPTPPLTLAMQGPLIQSQQHPMYFHQFGIPTGIGMQSDGTRPMYPLLPGGVQLSAGNPFCQMSNISLGNPSVGHQDPLLSASPAQMMVNNMNIANALKSANPNTMSTNLRP